MGFCKFLQSVILELLCSQPRFITDQESAYSVFNLQILLILSLKIALSSPLSLIELLFGRGTIDFIKKTCGAHYRMMTASWEVNKKSIWNYITASTGWDKSSYHALLPTLGWKRRERFLLQAFLVGTIHSKVLKMDWGLTVALSITTSLKKLKWTWRPKTLWSLRIFPLFVSLYSEKKQRRGYGVNFNDGNTCPHNI